MNKDELSLNNNNSNNNKNLPIIIREVYLYRKFDFCWFDKLLIIGKILMSVINSNKKLNFPNNTILAKAHHDKVI